MLSALAVILHHPLTCLVFALWSFVGPWNEGGDEFYHSMLTKFGYGDYHAQEVSKLHTVVEDPKKLLQSASDSLVPTVLGTESLAVETTTLEPAATPSEHSSSCAGDEEHLGKWRRGSAFLDLHYVCEAVAPEDGCMPGWAKFQDSCYYAELDQVANSFQAVHACNVRSGHEAGAENAGREPGDPGRERRPENAGLVVCETQAENQFVQKLVGRESVWIGLTNSGHQSGLGNWTWTDGSTMTYMNWDEDQPDQYQPIGEAAIMNAWKDVCMPPPWCHCFPVRVDILEGVEELLFVLYILCGVMKDIRLPMLCVFALVYKRKVTDHRSTIADFRGYTTQQTPLAPDFRFPLSGCLSDMHVCCHSWWFMSVRAGDTHQAAGTEKFWTVWMWLVFCVVAGQVPPLSLLPYHGFIPGLIMAAGMVGKRKALRTRLGIAPGSSCSDFMLWWCCAPCVVAQEAREVDQAAGVAVRCCCSLATVGSPMFPLVGSAVTHLRFAPNALLQPLQPTAVAPQAPLPVVAAVVHMQPPAAGYAMAQIQ